MARDEMKLPLLHGTRLEDPQKHWFLCEAVWRVKQITDVDMKVAKLVTMFRDCALNWYMNFSQGQNKNHG